MFLFWSFLQSSISVFGCAGQLSQLPQLLQDEAPDLSALIKRRTKK